MDSWPYVVMVGDFESLTPNIIPVVYELNLDDEAQGAKHTHRK